MSKIKDVFRVLLNNNKANNARVSLSAKTSQREGRVFAEVVQNAVRRNRTDIATWTTALRSAENVDQPSRVALYNIYTQVDIDGLLTSQIQNRKLMTLGADFEIVDSKGKYDEKTTDLLDESLWFYRLLSDYLDTTWWGYSLFEFFVDERGNLDYRLIPRKHVIPEKNIVVANEYDITGIDYTALPEYGSWLIAAGSPNNLGLLNKAVPQVLIKRFAQSCWSEFCEIYGMPPRILKTNTQDPDMMNAARRMMEVMGSAGWAIIDDTENFEFAQSVTTSNGEVYNLLIQLCNNEISLLNSGAIVGQDTKNGSRGKEQSSLEVLGNLVKSDKKLTLNFINGILPALFKIGAIPDGCRFSFIEQKDMDSEWKRVHEAMQYFDVPAEYIKDEFGIPVKPKSTKEVFR